MSKRIFVVDDEPKIGNLFSNVLERDGYDVDAFVNPNSLLEALDEDSGEPDVVVTDMIMPQMDGVELMKHLDERDLDVPIIIMTAHSSVQTAVEAMRQGAFHYLEKPVNLEEMRALLEKAIELYGAQQELKQIKTEKQKQYPIEGILGESDPVVEVRETLETLCNASNTTVLFTGETGTGKNLAAQTLHYNSPRAEEAFTDIDCASLPDNLLEAELFDYEEGAFTDARDSKEGLIEVADGGTLFLDEIDSMSLALQAKLLSFLESREFRRLGGVEDKSADVRILCATNSDLEKSVQEDEFRKDLFFRINVVNVKMPPLRSMGDDVLLIGRHIVSEFNREFGSDVSGFTNAAREKLLNHTWPGNVRELRNVIERAMIFVEGDQIETEDLTLAPPSRLDEREQPVGNNGFQFALGQTLKDVEKAYIRRTLETRADDSYADIADDLGISKKTLWDKRKRYDLDEVVDR
ncbi:sigma-54-dependent transcriptional regulator [Salinibacter ruber]|uniref:sigma-54-dependent transcriptional regulator n=1 Tax=Salinibacter ruber TaxID=146919 RepID=UPI0017BE7E5A|nr:sigma-54 dependent transcriptional regulator [Salinibacter ruber]MBB4089150.1 DNA-binding NtrC family response regulator [Salinibacter ruber]